MLNQETSVIDKINNKTNNNRRTVVKEEIRMWTEKIQMKK